MSKTIKIIELLNKIANNEDVPNKIKYRNCIFEKTEGAGISPDYVNNDNEFFLEYISNEADSLNEIVEIIEDKEDKEDKEEIDIQSIDIIRDYRTSEDDLYNDNFEDFRGTINELVKAVKQLDKKVNSIEQY